MTPVLVGGVIVALAFALFRRRAWEIVDEL
jgi:hypothetical protein